MPGPAEPSVHRRRPVRRAAASAGVLSIGVVWGAQGAVAAGGFPEPGSPYQATLEQFFFWTLLFATLLTLLVLVLLVVLTRHRDKGDASPTDVSTTPRWAMGRSARRLVIGASFLVPAVIIGGLGVTSLQILSGQESPPEPDLVLDVRAVQFAWYATYPDGQTTLNEVHVHADEVTHLRLASDDVIHSLFIPSMGIKQDVLPGHEATVWFEATRTGTHPARCAEFCGTGHPEMTFSVVVHPPGTPLPP